ncbi:MAG: hypothetical protein RL060_950 [Bacteroidota bacterium]|jgi:hypothetical protein
MSKLSFLVENFGTKLFLGLVLLRFFKPILPRQLGAITIGIPGDRQNNVIQGFTLTC